MDSQQLSPRRPWMAALLNFLVPGLGALYAGDMRWALLTWVIGAGIGFAVGGVLLLLTPSLGVILLAAVLVATGVAFLVVVGWRAAKSAPVPFVPTRWNTWSWYVGFAVVALTVNNFVLGPLIEGNWFKAYRIPSVAMEPTLIIGDFLFADRRSSARQAPERGSLVLFISVEDGTTEVIKRVIAVGGDTIAMHGGIVVLNGREQRDDPFMDAAAPDTTARFRQRIKEWTSGAFVSEVPAEYSPDASNWGPVVVPAGHLFALGDNRNYSWDSRFYGFVPVDNITGTPRVIYFQRDFLLPGMFARIGTGPR